MAEVYDVTFNIVRIGTASNDEGFRSGSDVSIATGIKGKRHFYSANSIKRLENGPGVRTDTLRLFVVDSNKYPAALSVIVNDRLDVSGEKSYNVIGFRPYEGELQIDTEIIG